jgi:hypothetical protein
MSEKREIVVRTSGIRAILAGFVNYPVSGDEASETAWFLTQEWNPLLAEAMMQNPPNTTLGGFHESTIGALIDVAKKAGEKYPDCEQVIQHGAYSIMRKSTGRQQDLQVLLLTAHKTDGGRQSVVVVGDSSSLTLVPG